MTTAAAADQDGGGDGNGAEMPHRSGRRQQRRRRRQEVVARRPPPLLGPPRPTETALATLSTRPTTLSHPRRPYSDDYYYDEYYDDDMSEPTHTGGFFPWLGRFLVRVGKLLLLLFLSTVSYAIFYQATMPKQQAVKPLHFDYTRTTTTSTAATTSPDTTTTIRNHPRPHHGLAEDYDSTSTKAMEETTSGTAVHPLLLFSSLRKHQRQQEESADAPQMTTSILTTTTTITPTATVDLLARHNEWQSFVPEVVPRRQSNKSRLLTSQQEYYIEVSLFLPESEINKQVGMFGVVTELYSGGGIASQTGSNSSTATTLLAVATRSCRYPHQSAWITIVSKVLLLLPILLGAVKESRTVTDIAFRRYVESPDHPLQHLVVKIVQPQHQLHHHHQTATIGTQQVAEVVGGEIRIGEEMSDFQELLKTWFYTCSCVGICVFVFLYLTFQLLIGIWWNWMVKRYLEEEPPCDLDFDDDYDGMEFDDDDDDIRFEEFSADRVDNEELFEDAVEATSTPDEGDRASPSEDPRVSLRESEQRETTFRSSASAPQESTRTRHPPERSQGVPTEYRERDSTQIGARANGFFRNTTAPNTGIGGQNRAGVAAAARTQPVERAEQTSGNVFDDDDDNSSWEDLNQTVSPTDVLSSFPSHSTLISNSYSKKQKPRDKKREANLERNSSEHGSSLASPISGVVPASGERIAGEQCRSGGDEQVIEHTRIVRPQDRANTANDEQKALAIERESHLQSNGSGHGASLVSPILAFEPVSGRETACVQCQTSRDESVAEHDSAEQPVSSPRDQNGMSQEEACEPEKTVGSFQAICEESRPIQAGEAERPEPAERSISSNDEANNPEVSSSPREMTDAELRDGLCASGRSLGSEDEKRHPFFFFFGI